MDSSPWPDASRQGTRARSPTQPEPVNDNVSRLSTTKTCRKDKNNYAGTVAVVFIVIVGIELQ